MMRSGSSKKLLSLSSSSETTQLPALAVFVAQHLPSAAGNNTTAAAPMWTPITFASTCTFKETKAFECNVQFKDVQRVDPSLPAVLVVAIQPGAVLEVVTVRWSWASGMYHRRRGDHALMMDGCIVWSTHYIYPHFHFITLRRLQLKSA